MKINMPVSQKEVELQDGSSIVSKTDLKGAIIYINREFLDISGFTEAELIGKNHNIIRHPDMPPAAFEDLWRTVKAGNPWNGMVKNRCKNGDHYWVEANVTPVREGDKVVGYMSVRSKPSRKQVEEAEKLYQQMREGRAPQPSWIDSVGSFVRDISIVHKFYLAILTPVIAMMLYGIYRHDAFVWNISIIGVGAAIFAGALFTRKIKQSFRTITHAIGRFASGDLNVTIDTRGNDESGRLMKTLKSMQIKVGFDVIDSRKTAEQAMRLQTALDQSETAFTFGDHQNNLQYMNNAAKQLWKEIEQDIAKLHPGFTVDGMMGGNIGQYLEKPDEREMFARKLSTPKSMELSMYSKQIKVIIVPVHNDRGEYLGRMTQWNDRTAEILAEQEVMRLVTEASAGNLSQRVDIDKLPAGFVRETGKGINQILDALITPLNVAAKYVADISNGEIPAPITEEYHGDFNTIKENLNQCIDAVNALIHDANLLSQAAKSGQLSTRADASKHKGDFRKIVQGVNETLDAVIGPLNVAAECVDRISKGDIPDPITEQYYGDFNSIKDNLNTCINAVNRLVSDANMLAKSAAEGRVTVRADVTQHQGDFRKVVEGVNATLETIVKPIIVVKEATETINNAAGEIAMGNNDLSSRTEEQASALEETASSMEELASTVKQNAENAQQANQLAAAASGVAIKGGEVVGEVVTTMAAINDSAKKIEDIISVIDGIAFQTNILALNAAVEAARAGEQGRGFAVVAGEVRNLAQRSASAAKEIKELITDSVSKTAEGTKLVQGAGLTMNQIVSSVQRVSDIISEIAAASAEQTAGIDQVNQAITSMDETTQQNAALVEQAAAAAESLVEQANHLSDAVGVFKLDAYERLERRAVNSPMRTSTKFASR